MTSIEWTEQTWNPVTGCHKVSPGCKHCYAETMSNRLQAMKVAGYEHGFGSVTLMPGRLSKPLQRRKPTVYFVNSMSDLFQEAVPFAFVDQIMETVCGTPQHVYQILTKRAGRMRMYFETRETPGNVWLGVSVEDVRYGVPRIRDLQGIDANVRFISAEPLLEDIGNINLAGIHWVIAGGESGAKARPMKEQWALNLRDHCVAAQVPFFFKQWGAWGADGKKRSKGLNGRRLAGKNWDMIPAINVG